MRKGKETCEHALWSLRFRVTRSRRISEATVLSAQLSTSCVVFVVSSLPDPSATRYPFLAESQYYFSWRFKSRDTIITSASLPMVLFKTWYDDLSSPGQCSN